MIKFKKITERLGAQKAGSGSFEKRCGTSIFSDGSSSCFYFNKKKPVMSISVKLIYDKKKKNCEEQLINIVFNEPAVQCLRLNSPPKCFQLSFIPFLNPYFKNNVSSVRDMKP